MSTLSISQDQKNLPISTQELSEKDPRFKDFLVWEQMSRDTVDFKKIYVDVAGDLIAGLLLSQIIYWYLPNSEGKTKLRVKKDNRLCIAKARHEWWRETRISFEQAKRAMTVLREKRIIKTEIYRFNGHPVTHIFLQQKTLLDLIEKELKNPKKNPFGGKDTVYKRWERHRLITESILHRLFK